MIKKIFILILLVLISINANAASGTDPFDGSYAIGKPIDEKPIFDPNELSKATPITMPKGHEPNENDTRYTPGQLDQEKDEVSGMYIDPRAYREIYGSKNKSALESIFDNAVERLKGKQFQDEKGNASTSDTDLPFMTRMTPKEKNAWSNSATNGFTIEMEMPRDGRKIPVPAIEHIPLFSTTVNIQKDGRLFVTEEIKIVNMGMKVRNGLVRMFPNGYIDRAGNKTPIDVSIISILRDGKEISYRTQNTIYGKVIAATEPSLSRGIHTYVISYLADRMISDYDSFQELVWNATGGNWSLIVARASLSINLPDDVSTTGYLAATGSKRAKSENYVSKELSPQKVVFLTTKPLFYGESLIATINLPANSLNKPNASRKFSYFINDYGMIFVSIIGAICVLLSYLLSWKSISNKNKKHMSVKKISAPDDISPFALRYISNNKIDNTNLISCILSMATKGFISINDEGEKISIIKTSDNVSKLDKIEKDIASTLFGKDNTVIYLSKNYSLKFKRALKIISKNIKSKYKKKFNSLNLLYAGFGIFMYLFSLGAIALITDTPYQTAITSLWVGMFLVVTSIVASYTVYLWKIVISKPLQVRKRIAKSNGVNNKKKKLGVKFWIKNAISTIATLGLAFTSFNAVGIYAEMTNLQTSLISLLMPLSIGFFYRLYLSPTLLGMQMANKVKGYTEYLLDPPDMSLLDTNKSSVIFSKNLPYAYAIDIHEEWLSKFGNKLSSYSPEWIDSKRNIIDALNNFSDTLNKILK